MRWAGAAGYTLAPWQGVSWTEREHRAFLEGLGALGRGDWRGISRQFVLSRTPTQARPRCSAPLSVCSP